MRFELSSEQSDLKAMAADYFDQEAGLHAARAAYEGADGWDRAAWQRLADVGFVGAGVPAELGGGDGGMVELAVILEQSGRCVLPQPLLTSAVATVLLARCDRSADVDQLLRGISDGSLLVVPTLQHCAPQAPASASMQLNGDRVTGSASQAIDAALADVLLIPATDGEQQLLVAVRTDQEAVTVRELTATDSTRPVADVVLDGATATVLAAGDEAIDLLVVSRAAAWTLLAAESLGGGQACLEQAAAYARNRHQFGKPIGSFQSLKHLLADVFVGLESGWPAAFYAAAAMDAGLADAESAASVAKDYCSNAFFRSASTSIQVHGGIGFTWDSDCHLYFKRATVNRAILGDGATHRRYLFDEVLRDAGMRAGVAVPAHQNG